MIFPSTTSETYIIFICSSSIIIFYFLKTKSYTKRCGTTSI